MSHVKGHVIEQKVRLSGRALAQVIIYLPVTAGTRGQNVANHVGFVMKWPRYMVYIRVTHVFSTIIKTAN